MTGTTGCPLTEIILKAAYVIPESGKVIVNGVVVINGDKIKQVSTIDSLNRNRKTEVIDFGNAVILPGLVNAHTHLELTNLHGINVPDNKLISWIRQLIRAKMRWKEPEFVSSIENGVQQSLASGTTTVADITNSGYSIGVLHDNRIRKLVFVEAISFDPSKAVSVIETVKEQFHGFNQDDLFRYGISPHAPYTASFELYKECARIPDLPLCTHIAETQEEVAFLTEGNGPFVDFLSQFRMMYDGWKPPGSSPVEYLESSGILKRQPLLVHCNYISDNDVSLIQRSDAGVVYCPRSHSFFGHKDHPFEKLMDKGINVAIGTDSLASNDSLSVLDEMKFVYNNTPNILPETVIAMGTINGAKALNLGDKIGKLTEGRYADVSVIGLPEIALSGENDSNAYKLLLSSDSCNIFTMVSGVTCYDKYNHCKEK
ncbi:MAG: amidohydrolase family protein [Candidatus Anammoxibacter sp.]